MPYTGFDYIPQDIVDEKPLCPECKKLGLSVRMVEVKSKMDALGAIHEVVACPNQFCPLSQDNAYWADKKVKIPRGLFK